MDTETPSRERGRGTETARTLRTGRPLVDGAPVDGPTLELAPESAGCDRLRESPRPLVSDPASRTWASLLERPDEGERDRPVVLQWVSPASPDPPVHHHPTTETFHGVSGQVTVVCEGDPTRLGPGDSLTVDPGQAHTFRNDTDETAAFSAELPSMRTVAGLYTAWALAHERGRDEDGTYPGPGPMQSLVLAADMAPETTIAALPSALQRPLWATVRRVAQLSGATGIDDAYLDASFWTEHVEQPELGPSDHVTQ